MIYFLLEYDSLFGELQLLVFLLTIITACESFMAFSGLMAERMKVCASKHVIFG